MQTIQINNPEIESFISSRYGNDTQGLLSDFVKFVKLSLNDGYPAISRDEAKRRVAQAVKEVKNNEAVLLNQKEYNKDMEEFFRVSIDDNKRLKLKFSNNPPYDTKCKEDFTKEFQIPIYYE